jgi:hypothetical protein
MIPPPELRARYSPDASAACWAEGARVRPEQVTVRSMNFGQYWRTPGIREVRCAVEIPRAFVRDRLDQWLRELADDARRHPSDDPLEAALRERDWPGGAAALSDPGLHDPLLSRHGHDLLLEWLGDGEPAELPGWMLNSVDRWQLGRDFLVLGGMARQAGEAVAYQDGGGGLSASLAARLERVAAGVAALVEAGARPFGFENRELALASVPEQEAVAAFEARHGVILPLEYRAFLLRVGNGGAGPGYGLVPLERAVQDWVMPLPDDFLRVPFRHTGRYDPEQDDELETLLERAERGDVPQDHAELVLRYEAAGTVLLCDEGCGYLHRLVVTGPTRGSVWIDGRGGSGGFSPLGVTFLEWYERWLENVRAGGRGTWWLDPPGDGAAGAPQPDGRS